MTRSSTTPSAFRRFAHSVSHAAGAPSAFVLACLVIVVWAVTGPFFRYSDTWQLAINTGTTIVTFLMCFVIQNTQNRDSQVVQLKLDELIRAVEAARTELVDMEDLSDEELHRLQHQFESLRTTAEAARLAREGPART
jgi:low affinity Fe/Cu permease